MPYHDLQDLLHNAVQIEQQLKKKSSSINRSKPHNNWTTNKSVDKGKSVEIDSRFKGKSHESNKDQKAETSKFPNSNLRSRDINCFKCKGRGHMARECPNNRVMILTEAGEYESQDEMEDDQQEESDGIEYPDTGELLITRRVLSAMTEPEETIQRENIFHTRCTIKGKVCGLIIDGGSCTNVASTYMVEKLNLERTKHPKPYKLRWLNDKVELKITDQVIVPFSVGRYHDQVICDVVPMQAGHLLLGRPWQFDKETNHNGRTNLYVFTHDKRKVTLAPLTPMEVHELQVKMSKENAPNTKANFLIKQSHVHKALSCDIPVLLMVFKEVLSAGQVDMELPA